MIRKPNVKRDVDNNLYQFSGAEDDRCLVSYMENNDADWALWALRVVLREGWRRRQGRETWGALDRAWDGWRNTRFRELLGRMFEVRQGP